MGHWYANDGTPVYQVPYADKRKGMRDTTMGDAKKLGLAKSVTTVLDVAAKPALTKWKIEQTLLAAFNYYKTRPSKFEYYAKEVLYESEKIGRESADKGAILHDLLEQYYKEGEANCGELQEFIFPVIEFMRSQFPNIEWRSEESYTCPLYGFGGKIDLYSPSGIVLDFKTKATSDIKKMVAYDGHHMQTAAYTHLLHVNGKFDIKECERNELEALKGVRRFNLFISTEQPGLLNLTESTDYERDWSMFYHLNEYWNLSNKFQYTGG